MGHSSRIQNIKQNFLLKYQTGNNSLSLQFSKKCSQFNIMRYDQSSVRYLTQFAVDSSPINQEITYYYLLRTYISQRKQNIFSFSENLCMCSLFYFFNSTLYLRCRSSSNNDSSKVLLFLYFYYIIFVLLRIYEVYTSRYNI